MKHLFTASLACLSFAMTCEAQVTNWTQFTTTPKPEWRQNHDMVYDSFRGVCVMFGGWTDIRGGTRSAALDDTWEWDGTVWKQITTATQPPLWAGHAMAFDSKRGRTVVTGNNQAATWEYDGTDWYQMNPPNQAVLAGHRGMTFDSGRGVCVFFGERNGSNETWEYDGTDWTQITTATQPPNLNGHSLAYDSLRGVTVVVTYNGQTWEYDGTDWQQAITATTPPGRGCRCGMVYDDARQVIVMFGGCGAALGDTWEYDGVDWRQHTTANAPANPRRYIAMAYDSQRRRTVLFGGREFSVAATPVVTDDTWEYSRGDCFLIPDTPTIDITAGGTQNLTVDAGPGNGGNLFWIFGSMTGTSPGLSILGPHIYLNPDPYTDLVLNFTNTGFFANFKGVLDGSGKATASFVVPPGLVSGAISLHHAGVVYLARNLCTTNPTPVILK